MIKVCTKCGIKQPRDNFNKCAKNSDGLEYRCRECAHSERARHYRNNREYEIKRGAEYRANNPDKVRQTLAKYRAKNAVKRLIDNATSRARKKGLPCDLDEHRTEIEGRVNAGRCELTGLPLHFSTGVHKWDSPSIDRIEPGVGYLYSNIRIVCWGINQMLSTWGELTMRMIIKAYINNQRDPLE